MGANEDFVLLKKRDKKLALKELGSQTIHYQLGVTLQIPQSDHLIFLSADVRYTLIGKIMRLLFQPNRLTAELWYHNTEESSIHFAIKPILKGGVLINKKVITIDDARNFFLNHGKTNVGINRICIAPKYIFQLGFVEEIKLTFHEIMVEE
jgi:hypothetical protein